MTNWDAHLELPVQVVNQSIHILAEGIVLFHADKISDERVGNRCMLALPRSPVGKLCAHCCDGVEPGLQYCWI